MCWTECVSNWKPEPGPADTMRTMMSSSNYWLDHVGPKEVSFRMSVDGAGWDISTSQPLDRLASCSRWRLPGNHRKGSGQVEGIFAGIFCRKVSSEELPTCQGCLFGGAWGWWWLVQDSECVQNCGPLWCRHFLQRQTFDGRCATIDAEMHCQIFSYFLPFDWNRSRHTSLDFQHVPTMGV